MTSTSPGFLGRQRERAVRGLARLGWRVQRLNAESQRYLLSSYDGSKPLPEGASNQLSGDNPELDALHRAYAATGLPVTRHSEWNESQLRKNLDLRYFRGDNVYVWQYRQWRNEARLKQYLALLDVQARDKLGLFDRLREDGLFGVWTFRYGERPPISRDLVDSVNEINYLESQLNLSGIPDLRVLDIGAGYGRLAHRLCEALPNVEAYDCVDAIPESTYLCDFYLKFHKVRRARSVPLHQHQLLQDHYHVAVNIHSFSECTRDSVCWWLDLLAAKKVPWLLIVPNHPEEILSTEVGGDNLDLVPEIERRGYRLHDKRPVYEDAERRELIGVRDHHFLFRRVDA